MSGIDPINYLASMISDFVKIIKITLKLVKQIALNNKNLLKLPL
jgi:hypothetical protein